MNEREGFQCAMADQFTIIQNQVHLIRKKKRKKKRLFSKNNYNAINHISSFSPGDKKIKLVHNIFY